MAANPAAGKLAAFKDGDVDARKAGKGGSGGWTIPAPERDAIIERAIREGRYAPGSIWTMCGACRAMCDGHWFKTLDGTDICRPCWQKQQGSGAAIEQTHFKRLNVKRYEPTLEDSLLWWSYRHFPAAFVAFGDRDDADWEARVLASIVRKRADAQPGWVAYAADRWPAAMKKLGPRIVRAGGYPIPGTFETFAEWVDAVRECPV